MEVVEALRWARETATPVTVRGAASAALGGAVANDGGLVLDLSHLDKADIDPAGEVCVVGAGARLRRVHRVLARRGLALPVYPSNLGATLAGWLATGGAGLNAFGPGSVLDIVRAADVVLPDGELVRFHSDGRLDVAARPTGHGHKDVAARPAGHGHREVARDQAEAWFAERGLPPFGLADLAGSEGTLGVITQLVVAVGRRPEIGAFLLGFADQAGALRAAAFIAARAGTDLPRPANLEFVSAAHRRHAAAGRRRRRPPDLAALSGRPVDRRRHALAAHPRSARPRAWSAARRRSPEARRRGARRLTRETAAEAAGAFLYVDFLEPGAARRFAARLDDLPGEPVVLADESVSFAAARFRPATDQAPRAGAAGGRDRAAGRRGRGVPGRRRAPGARRRRRSRTRGLLPDRRPGAGHRRLSHRPSQQRLSARPRPHPGAARPGGAPVRRAALRAGALAGFVCPRQVRRRGPGAPDRDQDGARPGAAARPRRAVRPGAARTAGAGRGGSVPSRRAPGGRRLAYAGTGRGDAPGAGGATLRSGLGTRPRRAGAARTGGCRSQGRGGRPRREPARPVARRCTA